MKTRRVMVLADDSLFLAGLLSMLRERPEIELITVQDMDRDLDRRVREIAPHVVVVDRAALDRDGGDRFARVLRGRPRTTLVALRLDRPELEVFQASRVRRATWEGFVRIVSGAQEKPRATRGSRKAAARHSAVKEGK